jgi:hypothetical protein
LNWFIPALANSNVGSSTGTVGLEGHRVCDLDTKKSMNVLRVRQAGQSGDEEAIGLAVVDEEEKGK